MPQELTLPPLWWMSFAQKGQKHSPQVYNFLMPLNVVARYNYYRTKD